MVHELRGYDAFDPSKVMMNKDLRAVEVPKEELKVTRVKKPENLMDPLSAAPIIVKEKNPYLMVQMREAFLRKELSVLDDETAESIMDRIKSQEAERWVNMSKDELRKLAEQYMKLDQLNELDDEAAAAK